MEDDRDTLLEDALADEDGCLRGDGRRSADHFAPDPHADLPVYLTIHR
jgi:hypothetical protein